MLDAIREAIDASDVKERYADAWNGFTVGFPEHGDGSAIQIDFAPKDGASYGISPITVQKAVSYSKTGEVKRIIKLISKNLPLTMTDKAIEDGVAACLEAIRTQIEGNAPWTVPSDLIDFVGDWTLNSYKDIIEDADEPLDRQQAFAVENASRGSSDTASGLDPATVKYLSVMKKLEQDKARKSLIKRILDAATGDDKKKAAKKAEKAASAAKSSGEKKNGKKSKIPPHRIECVSMGRKYGRRYVVVSEDGKVLDDAQGYGFRSPDAAERCFAFQQSGKGKEVRKAEEWWRQKAHRKILSTFENEAFYAAKEGRHILVAELKLLLELYGIDMDTIGIKPSMLIKGAENLI